MRKLDLAFAGLAGAAVMAGGTVALASPGRAPATANRAPAITGPDSGQDFTVTRVMRASAAQAGGLRASAAETDTFTCIHKVNSPHHSSHKPGTVNVVQTINCYYATNGVRTGSATVTNISMRTALYRNHKLVKEGRLNRKSNGSKASDNAAVTCVPGLYQGWGVVNFTTPPSWGSRAERMQEWGPENRINSCA